MSDESLEEILARKTAPDPEVKNDSYPGATNQGFQIDPDTGEGTVEVVTEDRDPRWDSELEELGLDPQRWEVYGAYLEVRTWDAPVGDGQTKRMRYVKAKVRPRVSPDDRADVEALISKIDQRAPLQRSPGYVSGDTTAVLVLADWQLGKAHEARGGTPETVERIRAMYERFRAHVSALRKGGIALDELLLVGGGDVVEQCDSFYPNQQFTTDCNLREQKRIARHLLTEAVEQFAPLFNRVVTTTVASNHGENRTAGGGTKTTDDDSLDLEIWENLQEIFAHRDAYEHVDFYAPQDPMVANIEVRGNNVAIIHGHQVTRLKSKPLYGIREWWKGQTHSG